MTSKYLLICVVILLANSLQGKTIKKRFLRMSHLTTCTYDYEVSVHTARGAQSTASDGYRVHALVDVTPAARDDSGNEHAHFIKLDVREPRLRRVRYGRVITNHPVNEEFEKQLSKPFYFRQEEHGVITDVLFPKGSESPEVAAFKKGIAGGFQLNLKDVHRSNMYEVQEHDDSGIYRTKYDVLFANDTHAHLHRTWTNHDYQQFADGTSAKGQHKVQSQHSAHVHLKDGKIDQVHRTNKAFFRPSNGHPRADNFEGFQEQEQDIEMSTKGYSKLTLRSCKEPRRSKRSVIEDDHLKTDRSLTSDSLQFTDTEKIKWSKMGGEKKEKPRPLYEVLRCFTDKSLRERDIADCSNELHGMVRDYEATFRTIVRLLQDRSHQNLTSWAVYVAVLAGHGKYEAQNALAQAVREQYPRPLSKEEYEALLLGIFYLPEGPLHSQLFDALSQLISEEEKGDEVTATAMLVLSGLTARAKTAGYNETLCDSVAEMVHNRYRNKSSLYHPDSEDHEMQLRDHIWAFGNLGHHSGLPVIMEHIDHDNSGIRSAVISAMRKFPPEHTNQHLMRVLHTDEHTEVKTAVVNVFVERHQQLSDLVVQSLEEALWHAPENETLDSSISEFLENHGDHPKAVYLRKKRSVIHRRKRALFPFLRPREFALGPSKRWLKTYGGKWVGAESVIQFVNQVKLRIGIFGGNFEVNLDNYAHVSAHLYKFSFNVVKGKAAFKASASFKNDFPKDLIHAIADAGDDLLKQFDSITSVIAEQINNFKDKLVGYLPLYIDRFVGFVNKIVQFVQNLVQPLRPVNLIAKVIKFAKDLLNRVKNWKWLIDKIKKIQQTLGRLTVVDDIFKKVIDALDKILDVVGSISKFLPHNLPGAFNIKKLLELLRSVSVDLHLDKIKDYFQSLGFAMPDGFHLQLPFKFSIRFSLSLESFQQVTLRLLRFANRFLDISSLLDFLEGIRLPRLQLPNMNLRFPPFKGNGFNFGLRFDWQISLKFNMDLKSPSFQNFIAIFTKLGDFFKQFRLPGFDLEKFFQEILPGKSFDLRGLFKELFSGNPNANSTNPAEILGEFLKNLIDLLDAQFGNVTAISDITDFFQELGPAMEQFARQSVQRICGVYKLALNSSQEFKDFGENVEKQGIQVLREVENTTQNALSELLNFTVLVDSLIDEIERNFTVATKGFVSDSLQKLTDKLQHIQNLADDIVDFANGTTSKVSGACTKVANFSADIIDKVQDNARQALTELGSFIAGPVAKKIKDVGVDLKNSVTKVEEWYKENLAVRVGKISRVAQIISDFLSILNTKKGFLKTVREIASRINEILKQLQNLPEYANKARKAADDVINFSERAQNYKSEIQKLDIRQGFGIDFDQRVRDVCNEFKTLAAETLNKFGSYDVVEEVNNFFNKEADKFIGKAVSKFREIKEPINEIKGELRGIKAMVREVMAVLIDLKPFTNNFSPILETAGKLPDCQQIKDIFLDSTKPCVRKALMVGKYVISQYKDFKKEVKVLYGMVPDTWKNFKIQKCIKGGTCISKAFIDQAKAIKDKADILKDTFKEASGYTDMLQTCEQGVDNITAVVDIVKLLIEQVRNFSLKDDVQRVKAVFQKITGRKPEENAGGGVQKRSIKDVKERIERIVDYIQKAKEVKEKMQDLLENTFKAMRTVYDDAVLQHVQALEDVRSKVQLSYDLWKKTKNINHVLQALDTVTQSASQYADKLKDVTKSISNPIVDLLSDTGEISDVVKPYLDKHVTKVTETVDKVNKFLDKVTDFLNKLQLRQRGLDLSAYKPWNAIPYCSEEVCLRSLRRSSSLYRKTIFTWKFPHLDDLSSMDKSGRWLTPGLFDDYKVEGISELSKGEAILGMHGVSSNKGKASLLVVTNFGSGVKKIIQLGSPGSPFAVKIGGVAVAKDFIWISDSESSRIHSVRKSGVTGTFSTQQPSWVGISKTASVEGTASSVSYDAKSNVLWVTDGKGGKAYGYKLSVNGDLASSGLAPDRVIIIGSNAQGMTIVRQFGGEYACISKCAMIAGFQCKLEFHSLSGGDETGENTLERVVRTPSGLESVTSVGDKFEVIAVAFSSGTYAEKENIELIGGDFEDRYFYLRLPILKMTFGIQENCLFFSVMRDYILRPRRLFPIGDIICGSTRKRSISQELLESDVYANELEEMHKNNRVRRQASDLGSCMTLFRGNVLRGYQKFFPEYSQIIIVFGIPVRLFAGAGGYYSVDYQGQVCMRDKTFRLGLIPGAWVSVYAGAALSLWIVEAGITIEARLLETYFVPELRIKIAKWPLKACIELKLRMTPLRIRVWLWYRFRLCIRIRCKLFGCSIKIAWCSKKTLAEWWWSAKTIDRTLFTNCQQDVDRTPPKAGSCTARQAADRKYFIQWHGFYEDTKINSYHIRIGSIQGSGDDFSSWVGSSLSFVVNDLPIMHGRDVYVSVLATNDGGMDSPLVNCPKFVAHRKGPQIRYVYDGVTEQYDTDYQWDTFALGMNFDFRSDPKDIVSIKWAVSSNSSCTLDEAEADIVSMSPLGDSTSIQTSGLDLKHGHKYFTRLYAMNSFGMKAVMCSDGILIDTTPPIPGRFQDGTGEADAKYLPSVRRVRGKFDRFIDPESPIIKYEWKIVKNTSSEDVTSFVSIALTQQTPLMEGLSLEAGSPYRLVLRGTNAAGLQTVTETNGFIPDSTPPICEGKVIDVTDEADLSDVDFVRDLNNIQAKWKCADQESGIREQLVGVGTYPGGDDVKSFEMLAFITHNISEDGIILASFADINIRPRVRYHVTVKVINGANLKKTITSDGILIDITPPKVAAQYIKDGVEGKDKNFTSERFTFSAHWEQAFADAESGLVEYRVGLGTKPGLTDIQGFKTVGSQTSVTISGLFLTSGQRYFASVIGCNSVGMCTNGSSDGAVVDFVPPHPGKVITGLTGSPVLYQWITKSVWARWNWCIEDEKRVAGLLNNSQCSNDSFYDVHSGVVNFGISVASLATDDLVAPYKRAGRVRSTGRSIELDDGVYSVVIEAKDRAGGVARGLSNTFIVDSSPPAITYVQHGYFGEIQEHINTPFTTFRAYFEIEDDLSKIASYKVGVGSYAGADDVMKLQTISLSQPVSSLRANWTASSQTQLENNRRYLITIWAVNKAGLFTIKSSAPLLSDSEAPKDGIVLDGWGLTDAQYQSYSTLYRAHWYGFSDFSGIETAYLGLSSKPKSADCDVKKEELVPINTDYHVLFGLNLTSGQKYYACLKLVDRAGNVAFFQSNGVLVDSTPPLAGSVMDGRPGEVLDIQIESSVLRASWVNFTEQETRIVSYQLAFGTYPGGQDAQELTNVGLVNTASSSRLKVSELTSGQRYYASVIAYNVLGMPSAMISSNGVLVDFTPPVFQRPVRDGNDPNQDLSSTSGGSLSATWSCNDPETSLASIEIAFGLQPGEADIMNFTHLPVNHTSFTIRLNLQLSFRYFANVRCINKVGLKAVSFSDGVVFDDTPPSVVFVQDGDYQSSITNVTVKFKFVDIESAVQGYKVKLWKRGASSDLYKSFSFSGNVTTATLQLTKNLESGETYYVNVTATNGVGLETTVQSDGFTVDTTPPMCLRVWDGKGDHLHDVQYAPSSSKRVISWVCYDNESPIVQYRFSVKNARTNEYLIAFYSFKTPVNSSGSAIITGGGRIVAKYEEGQTYVVGIEVLNAVGLKTINWTNGVVIDSTPPVVNNLMLAFDPKNDSLKAEWMVLDKQSGVKSVAWGIGTTPEDNDIKNFTSVSLLTTSMVISDVPLKLGRTYFLRIFAVNKADLSSITSSNGVVIDRTAPNPGVVAAQFVFPPNYDRNKNEVPGSRFVVTWTGFTDPESGIKKTSWAVGADPQLLKQSGGNVYTEVVSDDSVGGVVIENQTLIGNETYFVCIRVTNGAGLDRTDCSPGMLVILGKFSAGEVSDGPVTSAKDIDFQLDDKAIWAHWNGFKDPVFGISSYDWCVRDQPPNPSGSNVCKWPFMGVNHLKTSANRFHNLTLEHGKKYYVTVRAHNSRGEHVSSSSDGVVVDRNPPVGKSVQIAPTTGQETLYGTSPSAPVVTWSIDDPESGISHFLVGVGSFPFQDDLLSFYQINSLSRSVDLDALNFTLHEGLTFYVTVTSVNMLGLETTLSSQQVVVDWTPPISGEVADGNQTSPESKEYIDVDYQREKQMLSAHWSGFQDAESGVIEYHWCIGTAQGACDVQAMASAGLQTSAHHAILLQEGRRYFFTVEATNAAGLKETAFSDGVTVDVTPAVIGDVLYDVETSRASTASRQPSQSVSRRFQRSVWETPDDADQLDAFGSLELCNGSCSLMQRSNNRLAFSWKKPLDAESGVSSVEWCAGSSPRSCDIVSWTAVEPSATSVQHSLSRPLPSGSKISITLRVTNGVGMLSTTTSKPLLIDSTAPTVGTVVVGNTLETKYLKKDEAILADWSGFIDRESGLSHFEWAACHDISTDECITPFVNIGLKKSVDNSALDLKPGVSYVLVVRAHNNVGLFSEAISNPFILDGTSPTVGTVYDGLTELNDFEIQSSTNDISANWSPFTDSSGRIAVYEMCVGTEQEKCDVSDFVSLGITLKGTISGLSLNHSGRYFVTVKATDESGYSATASSNGVRVDSTPPVGGSVRDGQTLIDIDYQADDTYLYANWDEFQDQESDITRYAWCSGTRKGTCDIIPETDVGDRSSVGQEIFPPLATGMVVFVTVSAYNGAGAVTRVSSDGVKVDSTAPVISKVMDLQLGSVNDDKDYITSKDAYCARWNSLDLESGISTNEVSVCSAINKDDCLLRNLNVGNRTMICIADLEFKEGVKYLTKVRSTNNVRRSSEMFSDGFVVDSTSPIMGEVIHVETPPLGDGVQAFTHSKISVEWSGFLDKESGIKKYHLCVSTQPGECNVVNFTDVGNFTSYTMRDFPLVQGETYFVSIKAENMAGLMSDVKSSSGVVVDKTGPVNGGKILDGSKEGKDIDVQRSRTHIAAHWNAFEDLESDVIKVTWCAGSSPGSCDLVKETPLSPTSTSVRKVLIEPIINGQWYYITVSATNSAGVTTSITSDGVTVDDTPPTSGTVIDGVDSDVDYVNGEADIKARWFGFEDLESGIDSYEVALCDARNLSFCPQPFTGVGLATNLSITGLDLERGAQYIVMVRAVNLAGLQIEANSDGFTVDFTPPTANEARLGAGPELVKYQSDLAKLTISWLPFVDPESGISQYRVCVTTIPENCTVTTFTDVGMNTSFSVHGLQLVHGESYYAVVKGTNRIGMSSETTTNGILIDATPPAIKDAENPLINTTQVPPTTESNSNNSVPRGIEMPVNEIQESSHIRFSCSEELLASNWDEFEDSESELERYDWCVGTSKAQCDVLALRTVGVKPKGAAIVSRLASGTVLYATVYAVNGAGLKTRLVSEQCKVISVAPKIVEVIDVPGLNASNRTDIDWKATAQSLSLSWEIIGQYINDISRLRIQVAVTQSSSNLSLPQLVSEKSWNSEPLVHDFMDVLSWQRNVTIRSVELEPWERYRGVVRVWNEGGVCTEASSDGLRIEPSAPPKRGLHIRDLAAEQEHLRWLPNLTLPTVNRSALDEDVKYISSPIKLQLVIRSSANNTGNRTAFLLDHNLFSPTKEFKIIMQRVTSDKNESNTTEDASIMKVIPGFADPEGPCCTKWPVDPETAFTDTHFKATLPSQHFGASLARLPGNYFAVGSSDKAFALPLKDRTAKHITFPDDIAGSIAKPIKVVSHKNRSVFLSNGKAHIYESSVDGFGNLQLVKTIALGNCKAVSPPVCSPTDLWADSVVQASAISDNFIAMTGTNSSTNASVVAVFQERGGAWNFVKVLGEEKSDVNFGHSVSLNGHILAVAEGENKNSCISVYNIDTATLLMTICFEEHQNFTGFLSIHLTETDVLVVLSKDSRSTKVFQLNTTTNSYSEICHFSVARDEYLSGNLDVNARDGGFIAALGMQTLEGRDGVQLIGFHGIYSSKYNAGKCVNLGRTITREMGLRVDDGIPRASVSFAENTVLIGTPNVLTWPEQGEALGTGRVYLATYCPVDHFRVRVSHIKGLGSVSCMPCEEGRKSFGGFVEMCSLCKGMTCSQPSSDDPFSFTSNICDSNSCPSSSTVDNVTNGVNIHLMNGSFFVPGSENLYTVQLLETTRVEQSTSSLSESFIIDPTAPEPGIVYDGIGSDPNTNCSENSTFGEDSQCSTRSFEDTDIDFTNNTREIHARWIDFLDNESDIVEYFWCVGSQPMKDDIRQCESTGMRPNGSHSGLNLQHGDTYYVTVVACNGARRCSANYSNGVTIDTTPPVMEYVRDGIMGPDMDFQVFVDIIFAYFAASDPESAVTSYEVAWGTAPGMTDVKEFEEVTNTTIWLAKFKDDALGKGKKYFATVRATNGAGLLSDRLSSNGIVVGKSEYVFNNKSSASFFFDTVNVNENGSRKDGGVGQTYGTLSVPEGAVKGEMKLRSYSLNNNELKKNKTEEGPVSDPKNTKPKQFMLGNYSFVIKALDPVNNTVQEGYKFEKPITISMFYDVDRLVKSNKKHVNNEVTKDDVDPVLYLWDPNNETWFDASLTCPEPWSHVNKTIKLLTVHVCHLTQFAFFWSFTAQHGLVLFDKNSSIYNEEGVVAVTRTRQVTKLEIPVRRAKGSQGDITVEWSLYQNDSSHNTQLLWPTSGKIDLVDGEWNESFMVNVDSDKKNVPESVVWIQLDKTTGGALLASRDQTTAKILIAGNERSGGTWKWIVVGACGALLLVLIVILLLWARSRKHKKSLRIHQSPPPEIELPRCSSMSTKREKVQPVTGGLDSGALSTLGPVPRNTQMALSSQATPEMYRAEQSASGVDPLLFEGSGHADSPVAAKRTSTKRRLTGLLRKKSRDSYRLGLQTGETPASSEDELEQETSFATFKPTQKGLVNPLYEAPGGLPSASSSDAEEYSAEDDLEARARGKRRSAKKKTVDRDVNSHDTPDLSENEDENPFSTFKPTVSVKTVTDGSEE